MAGLEDDFPTFDDPTCDDPTWDDPTWDEQSHEQDVLHDRIFLNENCPRDPMILALPLMELRNLVIDPHLARSLQGLYEDVARRYLEMAALFQAYGARPRQDRP